MVEIKGILVGLIENGFTRSRPVPNIILPQIPQEIVHKFVSAIDVNAPETFQNSRIMPTVEGFEALVYHFSKVGVPKLDTGLFVCPFDY